MGRASAAVFADIIHISSDVCRREISCHKIGSSGLSNLSHSLILNYVSLSLSPSFISISSFSARYHKTCRPVSAHAMGMLIVYAGRFMTLIKCERFHNGSGSGSISHCSQRKPLNQTSFVDITVWICQLTMRAG